MGCRLNLFIYSINQSIKLTVKLSGEQKRENEETEIYDTLARVEVGEESAETDFHDEIVKVYGTLPNIPLFMNAVRMLSFVSKMIN